MILLKLGKKAKKASNNTPPIDNVYPSEGATPRFVKMKVACCVPLGAQHATLCQTD